MNKFSFNGRHYCCWFCEFLLVSAVTLFHVLPARGQSQPHIPNAAKGQGTPGVVVSGPVQATISDWKVPTVNSMPQDCFFTNRGGFTWYAGESVNVLGRFELATQQFKEFHLRPDSRPYSVIEHVGSAVQGTIYFTSRTDGFIGEFNPNTLEVREFRMPVSRLILDDIAFDRNGVVWFTVANAKPPSYPAGSKVGSLNLFSAEVKLADTTTPNASPSGLEVNSQAIPFFVEQDSSRLASVYPVTMKVTEYPLPNADIGAKSLTITSDDVVWYTDYRRGYLGRFDPRTQKFSEWRSPSGPDSRPYAITHVGGIIWYIETGSKPNMLVRFDPKNQKFQSWTLKAGGEIKHIVAQTDGSLWFAIPEANRIAHVVIDKE